MSKKGTATAMRQKATNSGLTGISLVSNTIVAPVVPQEIAAKQIRRRLKLTISNLFEILYASIRT
jgi:hypothetical protein